MASYETLNNGKVRAFLCVNGKRQTKTFPNKQKARSWVREKEYKLSQPAEVVNGTITVSQLFDRYAKEVSSTKKGEQWEVIRLNKFQQCTLLGTIKLTDLLREHIETWIAHRLTTVKASTVNRELNLISHCLTQARRWRLMTHNPMADLNRPKNPLPRFRRISEQEIQQLDLVMCYRDDVNIQHKYQHVAIAFHFAIETAMRAGEICALNQTMLNTDTRVAHLPHTITKNGYPRDVPLSSKAIVLINKLPEPENNERPIFQLTSATLDTLFRKYRDRTLIQNLHFHDTRHEAITRLANKLDVLDLARIVGHRDLKQLMTYYNKSAEELAQQLG